MILNYVSFLRRISCVAALTILGVSAADAQSTIPRVTTDVINDSFADGSRLNSGDPLESTFYTASSLSALSDTPGPAGQLDFASGSSGRGIFTQFAPQTLTTPGDTITASISFIAPETVGDNEDFRFGLFNSATSPGFTGTEIILDPLSFLPIDSGVLLNPNGFSGDLRFSTSQIEPGVNIDGFTTEFDINNPPLPDGSPNGDFVVRVQDPDPAFRTGRFTSTSIGFQFIDSSPEVFGQNILPGEQLTAEVAIQLLPDFSVQITSSFAGEVFELVDLADPNANRLSSSLTGTTFDLLAIHVTSDAFGSSNVLGEEDNGIQITNVTVTTSVPEPGSAMLLLAGLGSLGLVRRRK